jgi:hypothetical protein
MSTDRRPQGADETTAGRSCWAYYVVWLGQGLIVYHQRGKRRSKLAEQARQA